MLTVASVVSALIAFLPQIVNDLAAVAGVLGTANTAVRNAQASGGVVSQADWDALDAQMNGDLARLAQAAQAPSVAG